VSRAPPSARWDWELVLDRLSAFYQAGDWRRPYLRDHAEDPFQVLIGTILSQRTRDAATDVAAARLFARFPDVRSLAAAPPGEIARLVRPVGFYRTKSRVLRACARELLEQYGGEVPRAYAELVSLPGVGPKTANCVLVFGYGIAAIPVDTHVHRIANRLGVVRTDSPEATEQRLRAVVDPRYWIPLNPLLVQHGQNLCRPRGPRCERCPLSDLCATGRALRDGRRPPRPDDDPRRSAAARAGRARSPPGRPRRTPRRPYTTAAGRPRRRPPRRGLPRRAGSR